MCTTKVYYEIPFSKNSHCTETSRLIEFENQGTGFFMINVFTEARVLDSNEFTIYYTTYDEVQKIIFLP